MKAYALINDQKIEVEAKGLVSKELPSFSQVSDEWKLCTDSEDRILVLNENNLEYVEDDPEINTLCYGWREDERPEKPIVGYFLRREGNLFILNVRDTALLNNNTKSYEAEYNHIEPVM